MTWRPLKWSITTRSSTGTNAWLGQSLHLPPDLRWHRPGSHLFEQAGAYPGLPVFLLTNRIGKTSVRPRNSERKSLILSAAAAGALRATGAGGEAPLVWRP